VAAVGLGLMAQVTRVTREGRPMVSPHSFDSLVPAQVPAQVLPPYAIPLHPLPASSLRLTPCIRHYLPALSPPLALFFSFIPLLLLSPLLCLFVTLLVQTDKANRQGESPGPFLSLGQCISLSTSLSIYLSPPPPSSFLFLPFPPTPTTQH
jgi:hypothetical protein